MLSDTFTVPLYFTSVCRKFISLKYHALTCTWNFQQSLTVHLFFSGHINNLYNTCFWKLVQDKGFTPAQSQERLKVTTILNHFIDNYYKIKRCDMIANETIIQHKPQYMYVKNGSFSIYWKWSVLGKEKLTQKIILH